MRLAAALVVALAAPLGGCALTYHALALPENKTCGGEAFTGLIDLGAAAVGALLIQAEDPDNKTADYIVDGVFAGSALVGFGSAIVCSHRQQLRRDEQAKQGHPPVHDAIPDSMRLEPAPADPEVRDATPEEMGLVPAKNLLPPPAPTPPTEQP